MGRVSVLPVAYTKAADRFHRSLGVQSMTTLRSWRRSNLAGKGSPLFKSSNWRSVLLHV